MSPISPDRGTYPVVRVAMIGPFGLHPKQTMRSRALPLAKELTRRGHQVCLFMPPWHTPAEADKTWQEGGVTLRYVPLRGGVPGITRRLIRETLAWQPDVVHGFKPKAYSGLILWWLWQFHRRRLRLVLDTDDWEGWGGWNEREPYTAVQKHFFAWQERWGLTHCHALTVASRALQTIALSRGVPPERVVYVPNGPGISEQYAVSSEHSAVGRSPLTADRSLLAADRPTLLLYSRFFEFEVSRLAAVLAGVHTAVPQLQILLVGQSLFDADAAQLQQLLAVGGALEAITDVGWVEPEKLPAVLAQADVGIYLMDDTLLNRTKCPVKLADMLAVGIPVVAEAVGQVSEYVVHGRTGLLRPSGDVPGLVADLAHLLQNPAERQRLSEEAVAHIQTHFAWEKLATPLEAAYQTGMTV
ncbi:MAG: glycosyltransferase family 4 protein [Anaerolineae bacterium]|nr:glycosyltransferase family 4 protein [Anaerolineae bacterium]